MLIIFPKFKLLISFIQQDRLSLKINILGFWFVSFFAKFVYVKLFLATWLGLDFH
jgi:hypothetical protein